MNIVILEGRIGGDVKIQNFGENVKCSFSMALSEYYKDKQGQRQSRTEWADVETWGGTAENVKKYCQKGMLVSVVGKLRTDEYEKDGQKRYRKYVLASNVNFLSRAEGGKQQSEEMPVAQRYEQAAGSEDDLPF